MGEASAIDTPVIEASVRERLIEAAAEVFAERGYEGTRVQEVVRRAGLSTGAIYTNFRGKADLLLAAIGTAPIDALFETLELAGDAAEGLRRAGHLLPVTRRGNRPLLFEALVAARRDPEVAALLRNRLMAFRQLLGTVIATGHADGSLASDVDVEAASEFCQALGMGFLLMEVIGLPHADLGAWQTLIDRVVEAIASRHDPDAPPHEDEPRRQRQHHRERDTHGDQ